MIHEPVLLKESIDLLIWKANGIYLDGTGGCGGHSYEILKRLDESGRLVALDLDPQAISVLSQKLANYRNVVIQKMNFADFDQGLKQYGVEKIEGVILDLGLSSLALDDPRRGFSYRFDGPLDLRFNAESGNLTAAEVIKKLTVEELTRIIKEYGEQAQANKIAQALKQYLPQTTFQLTEIVSRVIPYTQKEKSLSRVFQALRIYVNRELDNLKKFLRKITGYLTSGGRLVVISYHSLEDRIVKEFLKREAQDCLCPPGIPVCICGHKATFKIVTPQPLVPSEEEIKHNPRSKSARLRSGERL